MKLLFSRDDLTVTGKANLVIDYPSERGIVVVDKSLTINGDITVTGVGHNGKIGFEAYGITIVGGNVKTKNVDYGLYSHKDDVKISGGTTEINALEYGICVFDGKINITSGITKVDVSGCSEDALQAENGINIDTQLEIAIPLNGVVSSSGGNSYIAESDGTTIAKNVTIVHNGTLSAYPVSHDQHCRAVSPIGYLQAVPSLMTYGQKADIPAMRTAVVRGPSTMPD